MGYAVVSIDDLELHDVEEIEPDILPVGVELRPSNMRPSVWAYDAGESSNRHYQREQEELYVPLSGRFEVSIGADADADGSDDDEGVDGDNDDVDDLADATDDETVEIDPGDYLVVDPPTVRQVTAVEAGRLLVVGAPNTKDDGVVLGE